MTLSSGIAFGSTLRQRLGAGIAGAGEHDGQPRRRGARRGIKPLQAIRPEIGADRRRSRRPARSSARRRPAPGLPSTARAPWCGPARHSGRTSAGSSITSPMPTERPPAGMRCRSTTTFSPAALISARRIPTTEATSSVAQRRGLVRQERRRVDRHPQEIEAGRLQRRQIRPASRSAAIPGTAASRRGSSQRSSCGHVIQMSRLRPRFIEKLAASAGSAAAATSASARRQFLINRAIDDIGSMRQSMESSSERTIQDH